MSYPACSSEPATEVTNETVLRRIDPAVDSATVFLGDTVRYAPNLIDTDNIEIGGVVIEWRSSNTSVLRLDAATSNPASPTTNTVGSFVAVGKGTAILTGTVQGVKTESGQPLVFTSKITVTGMPSRLEVTPRSLNVGLGESAPITASVLSTDGVPLFGNGVSIVVKILDSDVADLVGTNVNGAAGLATSGVPFNVRPKKIGTTRVPISARVPKLDLAWEDTVLVSVGQPITTVTVSPSSYGMRVSQTVQLVGTALDASNQPMSGAVFQFTSSDPTVATVDRNTGVVTAVSTKGQAAASATITAESGGKTAPATVTVYPRVAQVVVTPSAGQIFEAQTMSLAATVTLEPDVSGPAPAAQFSSEDPTIATVNQTTGVVTAVSAKGQAQATVTIRATAEGVSGTSTITVRPKPAPATIAIQTLPAGQTGSIGISQTRQFVAVVKDQSGTQIPNASVTWTSSSTATATVSSTGLATGAAAGTTTITATSVDVPAVSSTTTLVVSGQTGPEVHGIEVTPVFVSTTVGATQDFTAAVYSEAGVDITSQVQLTWSSSNTAVATVTSTGRVTTIGNGGATITATAGGQSMSGAISVGSTVGSIRVNAFMGSPTGDGAWKAEIVAYNGTIEVGRGIVNFNGQGYIPGLAPGSYAVTITHPSAKTQTFPGVTVTASQVTTMPTIIMQP